MIEVTKCLVCGQETRSFPAQWDKFIAYMLGVNSLKTMLRYCYHCRFSFAQDRVSEEKLTKYYVDAFINKSGRELMMKFRPGIEDYIPWWSESKTQRYNSERANRVKIAIEYLLPKRPKLVLDYGAGSDNYSSLIFPDAEIENVDVETPQSSYSNKKYDFIFLSQVLEHVADPIETLNKLSCLLKDDAVLWIEVPEEGMIFNEYPERHYKIQNEKIFYEHINFFSKTNLEFIAKKLNFKNNAWFRQYFCLTDGIAKESPKVYYCGAVQTLVLSNAKFNENATDKINAEQLFGINHVRVGSDDYNELMAKSTPEKQIEQQTQQQTIEVSVNNDAYVTIGRKIDKLIPPNSTRREFAKSAYHLAKAGYKLIKRITSK